MTRGVGQRTPPLLQARPGTAAKTRVEAEEGVDFLAMNGSLGTHDVRMTPNLPGRLRKHQLPSIALISR